MWRQDRERLVFAIPGQADESAAVFLPQDAHQSGEADSGILGEAPLGEHDRKSHPMNSHQTVALGIFPVDPIDRFHHAVDGLTGELVAEDIETDSSVVGGLLYLRDHRRTHDDPSHSGVLRDRPPRHRKVLARPQAGRPSLEHLGHRRVADRRRHGQARGGDEKKPLLGRLEWAPSRGAGRRHPRLLEADEQA